MLSEIVTIVNEKKLEIIQSLSGASDASYDKTSYLDDTLIKLHIEKLKKAYFNLNEELNQYTQMSVSEQKEILSKMQAIYFEIIFLASNNSSNIEECLKFAQNLKSDFVLCLEGIQAYIAKRYDLAYEKFCTFFKDHPKVIEHYLVNKMYGLILCQTKQYSKALPLLQKAAEMKPEDIEVHKILSMTYKQLSLNRESDWELEIIKILEG